MTGDSKARTLARIDRLRERFSGRIAIAARNLATGEELLIDHKHVFPTASTIKLAVLVELYRQAERGDSTLDNRLELRPEEVVPGAGVLGDLQPGLLPTLRDLAVLMIIVSDNTATNMLIDHLGGVETVNASMRNVLGQSSIILHRKVDFDPVHSAKSPLGVSSPWDLMRLTTAIGNREGIRQWAAGEMIAIMRRQHDLSQIPRFLGYNRDDPASKTQQPFWIANKTGYIPGVRADAGLIGLPENQTVAYCVMSKGSSDTGFTGENESEIAAGIAGRIIVEHWWPEGFAAGELGVESPHLEGYV
ncbi:hypothetical protein BH24CHL4_BH24CHL4_17210 [soil metagenome]